MATTKRSRNLDAGKAGRGVELEKRRKATATRSIITTRSMTRKSVSDAVFLTTELLENILRFLPMKDLLLSQRVTKKWRAVISESMLLQQALFFLPQEPSGYWELVGAPEVSKASNKLLRLTKSEYERKSPSSHIFRSGSLNPLVFKSSPGFCPVGRAEDQGCEVFDYRSRPSARHADASWRKMLVVQPPAADLFTHYDYVERGLICMDNNTIPTGATVGSAIQPIEQAESEGDTWISPTTFLSTCGILFLSEEEANMTSMTH
ncbi:hypothetical protein LTR08_008429 [Meristemomyces frigidus]|nr:hypothetical protein LTR08_008429 [Meristemomyces frigidus]